MGTTISFFLYSKENEISVNTNNLLTTYESFRGVSLIHINILGLSDSSSNLIHCDNRSNLIEWAPNLMDMLKAKDKKWIEI